MSRTCRIMVGICVAVSVAAAPVLADPVEDLDTRGNRSGDAGTSGCSPISAGTDSFPSTAKLVMNDNGFGEPFVVRLSSAGLADAVVQRAPQVGDTIATEILQLELSGFHLRTGPITLRQNPSQPSLGEIRDVELDGTCQLSAGAAVFDVFFEIELTNLGETWINQVPIRIEAPLDAVPPRDVRFEIPFLAPIELRDKATDDLRGEVSYLEHHADPPFPPPGQECFDTLLTADLFLFDPGANVPLFGFGPTTVQRGLIDPGGICNTGGGACADDGDCPLFDVCIRQSLETEIIEMNLAGFDPLLGNWSLKVLPDIGDSDCCVANGTPGCSDSTCQMLICGMDPFCCATAWDILCASLANSEPTCVASCDDPDAVPSVGTVQSFDLDRTYPANGWFDITVEFETTLQGTFRNLSPIPVQQPSITNLPPDPETAYTYTGAPITMVTDDLTPVGEISNVVQTVQVPRDCEQPPAAGQDCFDSSMEIELTLPSCPTETLVLPGVFRMLRDAPTPGAGPGQEIIETLMAKGDFSGVSPCAGAVTVRLSPSQASSGSVDSLAPEEFFPADSFFDIHAEVDTTMGTLTAAASTMTTTINALAPDAGEVYFGPDTVLDLLDESEVKVGEILAVRHEIHEPIACPANYLSAIVFTGPDDLDVGIPGGAGGVEYDIVRGDIDALRSSDGSFASASCLLNDTGPTLADGDVPASGAAFFYVARDGFQAFNGTWNSPGAGQQGDRDAEIGPCP